MRSLTTSRNSFEDEGSMFEGSSIEGFRHGEPDSGHRDPGWEPRYHTTWKDAERILDRPHEISRNLLGAPSPGVLT